MIRERDVEGLRNILERNEAKEIEELKTEE